MNLINTLLRGPGDFEDQNLIKFEESVVQRLLTKYKMASSKWTLLREHEDRVGTKQLTLAGFHSYFNTFPVYLQSTVIKGLAKDSRLFQFANDFTKRKVYQQFHELKQTVSPDFSGDSFGLVVKWPYIKTGMVFHNRGYSDKNGFHMIYRYRREQLIAEPFEQFLKSTRWVMEIDG
jgi:hypothetical protein